MNSILKKIEKYFPSVIFLLFVIGASHDVFAATDFEIPGIVNDDGITRVLCTVIRQIKGSWGKGVASLAIISVGIGLFLGKLSWGVAFAVALGIGLVFGAPALVNLLSGQIGADFCPGG